MGHDKRDAGAPLLRLHLRSPLSRRERAQPVRPSDVDRADDDPRRKRIVTHEQQHGFESVGAALPGAGLVRGYSPSTVPSAGRSPLMT